MSYRSQALASTLIGTPLSFVLAGLYAQLGPGSLATNFLVANLLIVPVWCLIMIWGLKRQRRATPWIWLTILLACAVALMLATRHVLES